MTQLFPIKKQAALFVLMIVLLWPVEAFGATAGLDSRIAQEEARMELLERRIAEHQGRVQQMGQQEKGVLTQINTLDQKKQVTEQRIRILELRLEKVKGSIAGLRAEMETAERDLATMQGLLEERMVNIYKYGGVAEFNLLLSSSTAHEAMGTSYLLNKIALQDQGMIDGVLAKQEELRQAAAKMESERKSLADNTTKLASERKNYHDEIARSNDYLGKVRKERSLQEQSLKELQDAQQELQRTIVALMKKKREEQERARAAAAAAAAAAKGSGTTATRPAAPQPQVFVPSGGRLGWPVQGQISSTFGTRVHPVFKTKIMHTGIDIRAPHGTPVKAAGAGEVLYAGWLRGYGQIVILDHGNDLSSVYAHLSSIAVREGAVVKKGQAVGSVGSTGTATGNHLHFEVRQGGDARDPMKYLR